MNDSPLSALDWTVIVVYLVISLALGLWYARKGNQGFLDFILSGRKLSWWLAGTSIVATTFSVDTPLYVTELVRSKGIAGNWQWWCMGIGGTMGILAVTFFAARWRRAEILTEVEFVELRYSGKSAAFLRGFKAVYFALVKNTLGLAALLFAMSKVLEVNVGIDPAFAVWAATIVAAIYTLLGGLWGVVLTDFFQFVIAIVGAVALAYFALAEVGGVAAMQEKLAAMGESGKLSMLPEFVAQGTAAEGASGAAVAGALAPALFLVYILFTWWANPNADGGGMFVQRMAACKNEKHAVAGSLWAIFAHHALRSWPWILAALVSIIVLPHAAHSEAYPQLVNLYLPSGWRGLMVVSFLAAFMSTVSTQLNWGASVLVNDLYKRFWAKDREDKHYVLASQAATLLLVLLPIPLMKLGNSVSDFVAIILGLGAGIGPALMARWFWWRANAWTEVAAIVASTAATVWFQLMPEAGEAMGAVLGGLGADGRVNPDFVLAGRLLTTTAISSAFALAATFLTKSVPDQILSEFCRRLRPQGFWGAFQKGRTFPGSDLAAWLLGIVFLFASLFGIGSICLGAWTGGLLALALAIASGIFFVRALARSFQNTNG